MKDYGLQAIGDRILVLRDKAPDKIGSIILAESAKEPPCEGTVVGLGTDEKFHTKIGDKVLFSSWVGQPLPEGTAETELLVMRESELLVVRRASSEAPKNGAMKRAGQEPVRS